MFERPHHQRIAWMLGALDGPLLAAHRCYFGGGTAIVLKFGEYRESVDLDFMVSDIAHYRELRQLLTGSRGLAAILLPQHPPLTLLREIRADQYGIRTMLAIDDRPVKFEIVLEGRIVFDRPGEEDAICGIRCLTLRDLATSKLLANSDRWGDDGAFNRDLIDLAMMRLGLPVLRQALAKAEGAYGQAIRSDLEKAIDRLQHRPGWMERCLQAMAIRIPKALVWQRIVVLRRRIRRIDHAAR